VAATGSEPNSSSIETGAAVSSFSVGCSSDTSGAGASMPKDPSSKPTQPFDFFLCEAAGTDFGASAELTALPGLALEADGPGGFLQETQILKLIFVI
jgi:hypothetical protein